MYWDFGYGDRTVLLPPTLEPCLYSPQPRGITAQKVMSSPINRLAPAAARDVENVNIENVPCRNVEE